MPDHQLDREVPSIQTVLLSLEKGHELPEKRVRRNRPLAFLLQEHKSMIVSSIILLLSLDYKLFYILLSHYKHHNNSKYNYAS